MTDFFGSVHNIELSNTTKFLIHTTKDRKENDQESSSKKPEPLRSLKIFSSRPEVWHLRLDFQRGIFITQVFLTLIIYLLQAVPEHFAFEFSPSFYCLFSLFLGALAKSLALL